MIDQLSKSTEENAQLQARLDLLNTEWRGRLREQGREHIEETSRLEEEVARLKVLLSSAISDAETARAEASNWRQLFLDEQRTEETSSTRPTEEKTTCLPEASPSSLEKCPQYLELADTQQQLEPPPTNPDADAEVKTGNHVAAPVIPVSAVGTGQTPTMASVANEFVGALTQALRGGRSDERSDGTAEMRHLAARQSSVSTKLPFFSGQADEWPLFLSVYRASTEQCGFTNAENAQRLQASLKGPARDAVRLMLSIPDNVETVISTLERRFGRPELVIADLVTKARSMKPLRTEDLNGLMEFTTAVNNIVMTMRLLNSTGHMTNPSLRQELVDKLPTSLKVQWGEFLRGQGQHHDMLSLEALAQWLTERADAASLVAPAKPPAKTGSALHAAPANQQHSQSQRPDRSQQTCQKCRGNHNISDCSKFRALPIKKRWDLIYLLDLCSCCFKPGHWKTECRAKGCTKCPGKHHPLLHQDRPAPQDRAASQPRNNAEQVQKRTSAAPSATGATHTTQASKNEGVSFMTISVILQHKDRKVSALALLDPGSSLSFVRQEVAEKLGATRSGIQRQLSVAVLGGKTVETKQHQVQLLLKSQDGSFTTAIRPWTQIDVTAPLAISNTDDLQQRYSHLQGIPFQAAGAGQIDLLIGLDAITAHQVMEEVPGAPGEPIARRLPLGWVCLGPVGSSPRQPSNQTLHMMQSTEQLDMLVAKFWEVEQVGLESDKTVAEMEAEQITTRTMQLQDGHISTSIPWVGENGQPDLPDNRQMAERRLRSLETSLSRRPDVKQQYASVLASHLEKGYVTECSSEANDINGQWLLPHFPVVRSDKETTKVRVVFDAAAKYQGQSLNDQMHAGPKLQQDLVEVLLRFCLEPVAIVGDIAEMFLQVTLNPEDRKYVRFLWRACPEDPIKTYEFTRLVFGLKASPYLACRALKMLQRKAGSSFSKHAQSAVNDAFYVDDLLDSLPSVEDAINARRDIQSLLGKGSFHIRKWRSNSNEVLQSIPEADRAANALLSISDDSVQPSAVVKTLGVVWDAGTDVFTYEHHTPDKQHWTKRQVLSKMASVYDPRGHIAPYTVRARLMFQELCVLGIDWDDQLPQEQEQKWLAWFQELESLSEVKIPRCFKSTERPAGEAVLSIHTFTDASAHATAATCYVRAEYPDGHTKITLAYARARAAPLKKTSIPKLELRGAVLGLRVSKVVSSALDIPISQHFFWTDSMNVVYWVRSQAKNFTSDVASKIGEIQEATTPTQWRHVPGILNPADLATRGLKANELASSSKWWHGPEFLTQSIETWPVTKLAGQPELPGLLKKTKPLGASFVVVPKFRLHPTNYASWQRLVRVTAWCQRFIRAIRTRPGDDMRGRVASAASNGTFTVREVKVTVPELSVTEVNMAERVWLATAQREAYPEAVKRLRAGKTLLPSDSLQKLTPGLDTSAEPALLVIDGRLKLAAHLPAGARMPVILPPRHRVTELVIQHEDAQCHHDVGPHHLLANLRERYWIVHGLSTVKAIRRHCIKCQRKIAKPAEQVMGLMPNVRTIGSLKPFTHSGVDFAGPFYTRQGRGRVN